MMKRIDRSAEALSTDTLEGIEKVLAAVGSS